MEPPCCAMTVAQNEQTFRERLFAFQVFTMSSMNGKRIKKEEEDEEEETRGISVWWLVGG